MAEMDDKSLGEGKTCFIVGPIGDRLEPPGTEGRLRYENATQMWENVFEPACVAFGLVPVRADKIAESGEIPEQIFTYLRDADVVIADLTGGNANVMYELGLRHTRDKLTIQIGEHERLPFDVNTIRTVKFKRSEAGLIDARDSLIEALRVGLKGKGSPVNATRVWNALDTLNSEAVAKASALSLLPDDPSDVEDDQGPGRLDLLAEGEVAMAEMSDTLTEFTTYMEEMTALAGGSMPNLEGAESFAARLTVVKQFADELKHPAGGMEASAEEFLMQVERIDAMIGALIEGFNEDPSEMETEDFKEFARGLVGLSSSAEGAAVSFTGTLAGIRTLRKMSNILRPVSKSLEHSINTILRGSAIVTGWADRFRELPGWQEPEATQPEATESEATEPEATVAN